MSRSRLLSLLVVSLIATQAPTLQAGPPLLAATEGVSLFAEERAIVARVTPGATSVWAIRYRYAGYSTNVHALFRVDDDNDGLVRVEYPAGLPLGRWVVVDASDGSVAAGEITYLSGSLRAMDASYPPNPVLRGPGSGHLTLALPVLWGSTHRIVVVARPGVGIFAAPYPEHAFSWFRDDSGRRLQLYRVRPRDEAIDSLRPGDVIVAVSSENQYGGDFGRRLEESDFIPSRPAVIRPVDDETSVEEYLPGPAIHVVRTENTDERSFVRYRTVDGSARAGINYEPVVGSFEYLPGESHKSFLFRPINDPRYSGPTFLRLLFEDPAGADLAVTERIIEILDDEPMPQIQMTRPSFVEAGDTGEQVLELPFTVSGGRTVDTTVTWSTLPPDWSGTVTVPGDASSGVIRMVRPLDDRFQTTSYYTLRMSTNNTHPVETSFTIRDDDTRSVTAPDLSVHESEKMVTLALTLSKPARDGLIVTCSPGSGSAAQYDFANRSVSATFAPGAITTTCSIPIIDDGFSESTEHFRVHVGGEGVTTAIVLVAILDSGNAPPPTLSIDAIAPVVEGDMLPVTVSLSRFTNKPVTFHFRTRPGTATPLLDYYHSEGDLLIEPYALSVTTRVPTLEDGEQENDETLALEISAAQNATILAPEATATILASAGPPVSLTLSIDDASVKESAGMAMVPIRLSRASSVPVAVHYSTAVESASPGTDYEEVSGVLTLAPGELTGSVQVPIVNDALLEEAETFVVRIAAPSVAIAGGEAICTIVDDDGSSRRRSVRH